MFEPESRLARLKLDDETKADTGRRRQLGLGQAKLPARRTQRLSERVNAVDVAFADFGPVPGREVGARNGQERVECGPERPIRAAGEVRRLPQEPPTTRGNRRERARKNPNRERLGFCYWWC